jgi:hypothetical protein
LGADRASDLRFLSPLSARRVVPAPDLPCHVPLKASAERSLKRAIGSLSICDRL